MHTQNTSLTVLLYFVGVLDTNDLLYSVWH